MAENLILTNIMTNMTATTSSLSESFFEAVLKRLDALGYLVTDEDVWLICFSAQKVENKIRNSCNTTTVPDGLFFDAVDMVCGEFLFTKKKTGKLVGFDFGAAVKQIQEGDTNITFIDGLSVEQQFETILGEMMICGEKQFVSFRKMSW